MRAQPLGFVNNELRERNFPAKLVAFVDAKAGQFPLHILHQQGDGAGQIGLNLIDDRVVTGLKHFAADIQQMLFWNQLQKTLSNMVFQHLHRLARRDVLMVVAEAKLNF